MEGIEASFFALSVCCSHSSKIGFLLRIVGHEHILVGSAHLLDVLK